MGLTRIRRIGNWEMGRTASIPRWTLKVSATITNNWSGYGVREGSGLAHELNYLALASLCLA